MKDIYSNHCIKFMFYYMKQCSLNVRLLVTAEHQVLSILTN
jgi:hypothetical protein